MAKPKEKHGKPSKKPQAQPHPEQDALPQLEAHLGYRLRLVSNFVSAEFARELHDAWQVSVAEWAALCCIQDQPKTTPSELARMLALSRGAVSKVLDKLESKGLIERRSPPEDQRMQHLTLTTKGGDILPELAAVANRSEEFFNCLDGKQRAQLREILLKLTLKHQLGGIPLD